MLGILGIAVIIGLCVGGMALFSGSSILMALGLYVLSGWLFIIAAMIVALRRQSAECANPETEF